MDTVLQGVSDWWNAPTKEQQQATIEQLRKRIKKLRKQKSQFEQKYNDSLQKEHQAQDDAKGIQYQSK